jgi:hypothetical protein
MLWLRSRFNAKLNALEKRLAEPPTLKSARVDLPPEVAALANTSGAQSEKPASCVQITQTGQMWMSPDAKPVKFTAQQTIATTPSGFIWRAIINPLRLIMVADYFVDGQGGLDVRLLGAVPLANEIGTVEANLGEILRYLAELPWNPDAILYNTELDWAVLDAQTIKVAFRAVGPRAEIIFKLNSDGLIETALAESRPYTNGKQKLDRPWHGRFWDYQRIDGRLMPLQGEVAWVLDGQDCIYWRGKVTSWTAR